jgi:hypothetical protein
MYYAIAPFAVEKDFRHAGTIKLGLHSAKPVFVGVVPQEAWNHVVQYPQTISQLRYLCLKENVLQVDYDCAELSTFDGPFVVVVHDLTDPNDATWPNPPRRTRTLYSQQDLGGACCH